MILCERDEREREREENEESEGMAGFIRLGEERMLKKCDANVVNL